MVVKIFKSKKIIIGMLIILVIIVGSLFVVSMLKNNSKDSDQSTSNPPASQEKTDDSPLPVAQAVTPPEMTLPAICKNSSDLAKQAIGSDLKETGNTAKTNNSNLTECNYRTDNKIATIRIYDYATETDAKADLSKIQLRGYTTKNKGKYTVSVVVVTASSPNIDVANKILSSVLEKL